MLNEYLEYLNEKTAGWNVRVENPGQDKLIIMAHGWISGPDKLEYLTKFFIKNGYSVMRLNISAFFGSLKTIYTEIGFQLSMIDNIEQYKTVDFLGHSMGGVIIKTVLDEYTFPNGRRAICLGTPWEINGIKYKANTLLTNIVKLIKMAKLNKIKSRQIKMGLIAGDDPNRKTHLHEPHEPHDGLISVKSAFDIDNNVIDKKVVNIDHYQLRQDSNVAYTMLKFYKTGKF